MVSEYPATRIPIAVIMHFARVLSRSSPVSPAPACKDGLVERVEDVEAVRTRQRGGVSRSCGVGPDDDIPGVDPPHGPASASAAPIIDLREAGNEALARYQAAVGG